MKVTGAQALFKALEGEGVEVVFGLPGGAILPAYDPLRDSKVRHVLCRHEQGAGHAAEGYAWATGKVGVAIATSGPGGCNLVTALADAKMDSVPMVAITGQVPTAAVGNDAFQEADITGITLPVTKHNMLVRSAGEVAEAVRERLQAGQLVVLESTTYPGTTDELVKDILERTGLRAGKDFFLAFSPEREDSIVPGSYIPFGQGPRICVGQAFAHTEAVLMLAELLRRYDFTPLEPGAVRPVARLTTRPARQILCKVARRA